jgi:O-antigen ligase
VEVIGAHNLYVEVLAELGVQGLVVLLLILVYAWRAAQQLRRRAPTPSTALLYEALGASLLVFAFSALFVHAQYQKEWWLLLAVITAARSIALVQPGRSEPGTAAII